MTLDRYRQQGGLVAETFGDPLDAEAAVRALHDANFSTEDISIAVHDTGIAERATGDTGVGVVEDPGAIMSEEHTGPGGISVGTTGLIVPNVGILIGGPLAVTVAETGASSLAGALGALGVADDEARRCQERYESGDVLVLVAAGARVKEARQVLQDPSKWTYRDELRPINADTDTTPSS